MGAAGPRADRGRAALLAAQPPRARLRCWACCRWGCRCGAGAGATRRGLPVEGVAFEGWLDEWVERLRNPSRWRAPAAGRSARALRPYQRFGYSWLEFLRRYGIGPAWPTTWGWARRRDAGPAAAATKSKAGRAPVLLICPTSVVGNWQREVDRFAPRLRRLRPPGHGAPAGRRAGGHGGCPRSRADQLPAGPARCGRSAGHPLAGRHPGRGAEHQEPAAKQTQAIRRLPAGFRLALTGTPVENRLSELWSIMHFPQPGLSGLRTDVPAALCPPDRALRRRGGRPDGCSAGASLILRRVKTDPRVIQDLPEKLEMKVYCNLTEEQATLYEAVVQESLEQVDAGRGHRPRAARCWPC